MRLINIGFGNVISSSRIVLIVSPDSAPIKRIVQNAKAASKLIDATYGRKCKSVIVTDSDHIVLSALTPETVTNRTEEAKQNE